MDNLRPQQQKRCLNEETDDIDVINAFKVSILSLYFIVNDPELTAFAHLLSGSRDVYKQRARRGTYAQSLMEVLKSDSRAVSGSLHEATTAACIPLPFLNLQFTKLTIFSVQFSRLLSGWDLTERWHSASALISRWYPLLNTRWRRKRSG
jgi:hypothetical protein